MRIDAISVGKNPPDDVNVIVEVPVGGHPIKYEMDKEAGALAVDRFLYTPMTYPGNYGFVPQTVSYDGDPFDVLVLGPPLDGGRTVRGVVVGLMFMEDEKGADSKVVLSTLDRDGNARHQLTASVRREVGDYFGRYKRHQPGAFSRVPGWGSAKDGVALVRLTHAFFTQCRRPGASCSIDAPH